MFWRMTGLSTASPVETILDKEDYTLEELLDEDEIIQECKSLNSRLINFLRETTQVEQLLKYIVEEAPDDAEKKRTFKFPYMACEIFTCEVDVILRTLVENEELMSLLFSFIKPDRSHTTLLAGYFSKVVTCLILRKAVPFMNFIQGHQEIIHQLVDLVGITSIMEVLIRLIGADDHMYSNYMDATPWLEDINVLDMIVDKLSSSESPEVHANAAEILCAITRYAPPGLAAKISSPSFVGRLFQHALEESRPKSVLIHSLTVCISLLDPKRFVPAPYYSYRSQLSHGSSVTPNPDTVVGMLENLGDLLKLLDNTPPDNILPTTYGSLQPPLGKHRLKIVEFISVLLTIGNETAEKELIRLGAIQCILDLFFEYPFNNFLHHHVENILISCLENRPSLLIEHLLFECNLTGRILGAEKNFALSSGIDKPTMPAEGKATIRIGNIGHMTRVANKLVQLSGSSSIIQKHLQENSEWLDWQTNELLKRNAMENVYQWGCGRPSTLQDRSRDSDDEDIRESNYEASASDDYVDSGLASLRLGDDTDRSLITNSNWFAFDTDRFVSEQTTSSFFSPSPLTDEIDEVVVGENDDLLDTATSCQFPESGVDSEEPESVVLVNGPIKELEDGSKYLSTVNEFEKPPEWVEWRESSEKMELPDSQRTPVLPNGAVEDVDVLVAEKAVIDTMKSLEPPVRSKDEIVVEGALPERKDGEADGSLESTILPVAHSLEPKPSDGCMYVESGIADAKAVSN